jgi:hypothetical protein
VTFACDPILDLSLEIKARDKVKKLKKENGTSTPIIDGSGPTMLGECLDEYLLDNNTRFTVPEKLGANQYLCKTCGTHEVTPI